MLYCLLYHKVLRSSFSFPYSNPLPLFKQHLAFIAARYKTVHPGSTLKDGPNVCLTFDDASCDFFFLIYPLLKKFQLKACLAVPTAFPLEAPSLSKEKRLELVQKIDFNQTSLPGESFCSWQEIKEMAQDPLITIASHSHTHQAVPNNFEQEVVGSKRILEETLNVPITSFIYPFGKYKSYPLELMQKHYRYLFRIGGSANKGWKNADGLIYRANSDNMTRFEGPLSSTAKTRLTLRYYLKQINSFTKNQTLSFIGK